MDLNKNIKSIIYSFYTYSKSQLILFKKQWQLNIDNVNKLFRITNADYVKECYVCKIKSHRNCECSNFYNSQHIINSMILK